MIPFYPKAGLGVLSGDLVEKGNSKQRKDVPSQQKLKWRFLGRMQAVECYQVTECQCQGKAARGKAEYGAEEDKICPSLAKGMTLSDL